MRHCHFLKSTGDMGNPRQVNPSQSEDAGRGPGEGVGVRRGVGLVNGSGGRGGVLNGEAKCHM